MSRLDELLRWLFFWLVVRPVVLVGLGLNVRHRERLPAAGPAIVVANHNSHLDTMVLMTLLPSHLLPRVHPVAAADYFLRHRLLAWFALRIVGIIPIERRPPPPPATAEPPPPGEPPTPGAPRPDALAAVAAGLERGDVVILFPEGTRGEPERLADFKSGVARLVERFPAVPVIPIFLHGLGKALPRGKALPVPFFCDVFVGEPVPWRGDRKAYVEELRRRMQELAAEGQLAEWLS
ncbi:MAG TPA: lysophospholipid acyltransferase family protein [Thermoanaerobaculia bacterium]|nr:lysophospholipid acyltransferase family protein [Thermoanaerobaculia bacterium]